MARSSSGITHRISITGGQESKKTLQDLAAAGERIGPALRSSLQSVSSGAQTFENNTRRAASSTRQLGFAVTNLSFQVNDIATSLASGSSFFQVFAQQAGQVFQALQQGGGARAVLTAFAASVASVITPMRVMVAGAVAAAAGLALLISRSVEASSSAREFDVILKAVGKSGSITGKDLEEAAERLREVGLTSAEAAKHMKTALREGADPGQVEKLVKIGANLNAALGEGSLERFVAAAAKGGAPLREFAVQLGILPREADKTADGLDRAASAIDKTGEAIAGVLRKRNQAIVDERRRLGREMKDMARERGTPEQEAYLQSQRRIQDINRDTNRSLSDLYRQRNEDADRALKEYNKKLAERPPSDASLIRAIEGRVSTSAKDVLGGTAQAMRELSVEWNKLINALAKSPVIEGIVRALSGFVTWIAKLLAHESGIPAIGLAIVVALPLLLAIKAAFVGLAVALGPIGLAIAGVVAAIILIASNWDTIVKTLAEGWLYVEGLFKDGATAVGAALSDLWKWATAGLTGLVSTAAKLVGDLFSGIGQLGSSLMDGLSQVTMSVLGWIKEQTVALWEMFTELLAGVVKWIDETIKTFLEKVRGVFDAVSAWIKEKVDAAFRAVLDGIGLVLEWFGGFRDKVTGVFTLITDWIKQKIDQWLGWFSWVINKAAELAKAVAGALGQSKQVEAREGGRVGLASGGRVFGPGTGTSDSIPVWVSTGEYIVNALSTRKFLPLLQAINRGVSARHIYRLMPKFALGGRVGQSLYSLSRGLMGQGWASGRSFGRDPRALGGGQPRVTMNLTLGGQTFRGLQAPEETADQLVRASRKEAVSWIGRKPGWYGG